LLSLATFSFFFQKNPKRIVPFIFVLAFYLALSIFQFIVFHTKGYDSIKVLWLSLSTFYAYSFYVMSKKLKNATQSVHYSAPQACMPASQTFAPIPQVYTPTQQALYLAPNDLYPSQQNSNFYNALPNYEDATKMPTRSIVTDAKSN